MLLHPATKKSVDRFIAAPSHALIIEGPAGSGKSQISEHIAAKLLQVKTISNKPNVLILEPEDGTVTIDQIRQARKFVKLKTTGSNAIRRILIVKIDGNITVEAQNAFLKLLEEPPEDTVILITAISASNLLATITSRTQSIKVFPIEVNEAVEYYSKKGFKKEDIITAYNLADAKSDLINNILDNEGSTVTKLVDDAKNFLASDYYDRLIATTKFSKDKANLAELIKTIEIISAAALKSSVKSGHVNKSNRWLNITKLSLKVDEYTKSNANVKLLATYLSLNI